MGRLIKNEVPDHLGGVRASLDSTTATTTPLGNPWNYKLFLIIVLYDKCLCLKARRRADRVVDLKVPNECK